MPHPSPSLEAPPAWRRYLAYFAVAAAPMTINIEKLADLKSRAYLSPLDLLLPVLALLMLHDLWRRAPWARFKRPPLAGVAWAALALVSCLWIEGFPSREALAAWAKAALNPLLFGVVAVWVFQNFSASAAEYRRLTLILGASYSLCLLLALKQYAGPAGIPYDPANAQQDLGGFSNVRVAGWYEFRGVFGAQAALLAPAAAAFAVLDRDSAVRGAAAAVAVLSLCVTLATGGFLGACAGILAVAAACATVRGYGLTGAAVLAALIAVLTVVLPRLPRDNDAVLLRGVSLYASEGEQKKPTARLRRYQAALDLLAAPSDARNPLSAPVWQKGVGVSQYQTHINRYYHYQYYPKPGRRTDDEAAFDLDADEPFTYGLLESTAVELGVPGLLSLLFLFGAWILAAGSVFARAAPHEDRRLLLSLAALGAGCGALTVSVFANPAIRGVGGSLAFFLALALCAGTLREGPEKA